MGNKCKVCAHPERAAIEEALLDDSVTYRSLSERFNVGAMSLVRHKKSMHIGPAILEGARLRKTVLGADLLDKLLALEGEGLRVLAEAKTTLRDTEGPKAALNLALTAIGRVAGLIESEIGLVQGARKMEINVQTLIVQDPSWGAVLRLLTDCLRPHPLAFRQLVEGLRGLKLLPVGGNGGQAG